MGIIVKPNEANDAFLEHLTAVFDETPTIAKRAVYAGAGIVADAVRAATPVDEGDLVDSLGITGIKVFSDGCEADISYDGYGRKGVPNILKARAIESGTSRIKKKPFFRPAVRKAKKQAISAMSAEVDIQISKLTE